jgi:hypothetical protein
VTENWTISAKNGFVSGLRKLGSNAFCYTSTNMSFLDYINLVSSLASLILSILAIWLSLYFYTKSKDTEKTVDSALTGIRTQTDSLQKLSSKQLDKYTTYATTPRPPDESWVILARLIETKMGPSVQANSESADQTELLRQMGQSLVDNYIAVLYYSGMANVAFQRFLPEDIAELEENTSAKAIVDLTNSDFRYVKGWIDEYAADSVESSRLKWMYDEAIDFESHVQDTSMTYAARQQDLG